MGCCGSDSVLVSKMASEVKSGAMLWYKRRFLRSNWRNVHCVLYSDSSMIWYKDKTRQEKEGALVLNEAPELLAFVPYSSQVLVPHTLQFLNKTSDNYVHKKLMAVGVRGKNILHCFLCQDEEEVQNWMAAILNTIPSPPPHLKTYLRLAVHPLAYTSAWKLAQQQSQQLSGTQGQTSPQPLSTAQPPQKIPNGDVTSEEDNKEKPGNLVGGGSFGVGMLLGGALGAAFGGGHALPQGSKGDVDDNKRLVDYYPDVTDDQSDEQAALTGNEADDSSVQNDAFAREKMMNEYHLKMRQGTIEQNNELSNEYNHHMQHDEYYYYTTGAHEGNGMYPEDGGDDGDFAGDNGDFGGDNGDFGGDGGDYMACFTLF